MIPLQYLSYPQEVSLVTGVVIFLHGLGASAEDFTDLPGLLSLPPTIKYFFPQAPYIPVTINGGMSMPAWYDIKSISFERESDSTTVSQTVNTLSDFLDRIIDEGTLPDKILIGGFSQGGAMALEVGLNSPHKLAGIISLSAYSLSIERVERGEYDHKKNIPTLCCHGKQDQVVPFELGDKHRKIFQKQGFNLTWHEEEKLGHSLSMGEVEVMKRWVKGIF